MSSHVTPKVAIDFTTALLDQRISFARATSASNPATYIGSTGYITSATDNLTRFDYDPGTLVCKGLLVEESKQNYILQSNTFTSATWSKGASSFVTDNSGISPDGTQNADRINLDASELSRIQQGVTAASATWTYSIWLKCDSGTLNIRFGEAGSLSNITVTSSWKRYFVSVLYANPNFTIRNSAAGGAKSFLAYGAQLELGASPTSYIPTTTTALTRNADVATITGTNFSSFWQAGRGGILVRALPSTVSGTRPLVQFDDATADNIIALRGNTTNPELYIRSGGVDQATIDAGTISAAAYRLAGTWAAGNAAASLNSGASVLGAPGAIPAATQARLGSDGTNYLNGHLQALEYYDASILNGNLPLLSSSAGYNRVLGPVLRDQVNVSQVNHRVIY